MNDIDKVMTFAEAEGIYGLAGGTLRKYVSYKLKESRWKEGVDYRKSGKTWLITKKAMERIYGER